MCGYILLIVLAVDNSARKLPYQLYSENYKKTSEFNVISTVIHMF